MNRIDEVFARLREKKEAAFVAFLPGGDPDTDTSLQLVEACERAGADIVELGIPFTDPIADGPAIQAAFTRALQKEVTPLQLFQAVRSYRQRLKIPILAMLSYSIVFRMGEERFVREAEQAGIDGAIVPDLPPEEADGFRARMSERGLSLVFLVAPNTSLERRKRVVEVSSGFVYYVSLIGITGVRKKLPEGLLEDLKVLRGMTQKPVAVGFGISRPEQAKMIGRVADGVIVGSAIVEKISSLSNGPRKRLLSEVESYVRAMAQAVHS